ncbi:hypothetical protein SUNI508_06573 [Seiridium unicorne]|uniref:Oxidoreductase acuF-like C2H2 type zinc-finger domain-containing protein n=1 Tax=Seiridium unicorne TaxID=138068 RepID=A0ABR2V040_9PEZI
MSTTIAEHVAGCLEAFESLSMTAFAETKEYSRKSVWEIKNQFSRFKVWSGNIGAHQRGKSSLDYRLRDASHLASQVQSLLADLKSSLEKGIHTRGSSARSPNITRSIRANVCVACSILDGTRIPWDRDISEGEGDEEEATSSPQDDIGFFTEMEQISTDVVEVLNCLMNLSVSIRNPAPHDRFRGSVETDTSFYEASDIAHIRAKYENADSELITLLGRANSRRRQYFKYRELHHQKLSQGLDLNFDTGKSIAEHTVASSIPSILKTKPLELTDIVNTDAMSDSGFTQTSYASSGKTSDRPRFPALPADSANGPFECPFCFMMVSVTNSHAWR